ncbi:MAG: SDR family oxidoreductase [Proteobacteria bacterium]|nr:SDR family oxidoreductase [Pseudomonadota bacterium]
MPRRKAIVAGALGLIGRAVVEHLSRDGDWEVVGLSRRAPDFETRAEFLPLDLTDRDACRAALAGHADATHLIYAALYEKPELAGGWRDPEHIRTNLAMLRNLFESVESPRLEHVTLLQGTKAYGGHLGLPMRIPAKEREPRVPHPNFYFEQEDWLRERQAGRDWRWTIFRPQVVLGVAARSAMNVVAGVGAYAALCRERSEPLRAPGHRHHVTECTDARLQARAIEWAGASPAAADEIFNIANGDVIAWHDFWPRLAEFFGLEPGEPDELRMSVEMPRRAEDWRRLAERENLKLADLDELIGLSWQYADMIWANPRPAPGVTLVSSIKLRQAGFADCVDSEDAFLELLEEMRRERYLPA